MSTLLVVAHPDDEILGFGASAFVQSKLGERINCLIICGNAEARKNRPELSQLRDDMIQAAEHVGIKIFGVGQFANIRLNTVPHIEIVQFIEAAIVECRPRRIITHHPHDLNQDHYFTSLACQAASRLFQRREDIEPLEELLFMEVLSSTDWSFSQEGSRFVPNSFIEVGNEALLRKIEALSMYEGVMRSYPHPRSIESITGLASIRGSQSGLVYAEAFQSVFSRYSINQSLK